MPQSVLDKARQVQEQGGMQQLDKLINDLPELLSRNREILDEVCIKKKIEMWLQGSTIHTSSH